MADEFYNPKEEYNRRIRRLAHDDYAGDWGGVDRVADREWIRKYEEAESWNGMGG